MTKSLQFYQTPEMMRIEYQRRMSAWYAWYKSNKTTTEYFNVAGSDSGSCFNR